MKIALVMKDYDEGKGGAERYLVAMAQQLAGHGISVDLIVNKCKGNSPEGIGVRKVKAITRSSVLRPWSFNRAVQQFLKSNSYDLVYGLTQIYPQDVYRAGGGLEHEWLRIRYPKWWQQIFNRLRPKIALRLYMENQIFKAGNFKKIITNSLLCKYQILGRYQIAPEDIVVVYNGLNRKEFSLEVKELYRERIRKELGISSEDKVILFVSNNWKRKGLRELLAALAEINDPALRLLVLGRGNKNKFGSFCRKLQISSRVIFAGVTDRPWEYYGAGDLLVLPTYYDPCANVCLEALACGLPVVTTRMNGASELIQTGLNGWIVEDPKDIQNLVNKIKLALCNNDLVQKREQIAVSCQKFTLEKNVTETLTVLESCSQNDRSVSKVVVNNGYRKLLEKNNWLDFNHVMNFNGGELFKKNKLRSVIKVCIGDDDFFIKRHFKDKGESGALQEWQSVNRLQAIGINTMQAAAMGQDESTRQSFLMTAALTEGQRLEDFIPQYFQGKLTEHKLRQKRDLIAAVARLTRRLHENALFHKDFYAGHIFVSNESEGFKLTLIDLQRLTEHRFRSLRWQIKDLASLNFSCCWAIITNTDRLRFLKYYLGDRIFNRRGKSIVSKITAKTKFITEHTEKLLERRKK